MIEAPTLAPVAARPAGLLRQRLREGTAAAHEQLEAALDLLGREPDRQRFARMLERFLGFHIVWEKSIRRHPDLRAFVAPRSRLPHLRRDLAALGRTNAEQAALPRCAAAAELAPSRAAAVGSIYVLEGSTLGGQVIARALAGASWVPPGGLAYFNPYQARTGEMWRAFGAWAESEVAERELSQAVAGAAATFAVLEAWVAG